MFGGEFLLVVAVAVDGGFEAEERLLLVDVIEVEL